MPISVNCVYLGRHYRIPLIPGNGQIFCLMNLLSSQQLLPPQTCPSFFGITKVGKAHSVAPTMVCTLISHNHFNSCKKTCPHAQETGYGFKWTGFTPSSSLRCIFHNAGISLIFCKRVYCDFGIHVLDVRIIFVMY